MVACVREPWHGAVSNEMGVIFCLVASALDILQKAKLAEKLRRQA